MSELWRAAPTNGLIVEGNVGIGTTGPLVKVDVEGATLVGAGNNLVLGRTGNDYGHRLYMDANNDFHWMTNVGQVNFANTTDGIEAVFIKTMATSVSERQRRYLRFPCKVLCVFGTPARAVPRREIFTPPQ